MKKRLQHWDMLDMIDQFILGEEIQETMPIKKEDLYCKEFREFVLEVLKLRSDEANREANYKELASYDWVNSLGQNKDI